MKLTIDNLLGQGPVDYTAAMDGTVVPRVERKINQPAGLRLSLVANTAGFETPVIGARVVLAKTDGGFLFTGYLTEAPRCSISGSGRAGGGVPLRSGGAER